MNLQSRDLSYNTILEIHTFKHVTLTGNYSAYELIELKTNFKH
jgi:hypothetical protein